MCTFALTGTWERRFRALLAFARSPGEAARGIRHSLSHHFVVRSVPARASNPLGASLKRRFKDFPISEKLLPCRW